MYLKQKSSNISIARAFHLRASAHKPGKHFDVVQALVRIVSAFVYMPVYEIKRMH